MEAPGINVNVQNKIGDTALHSAAWKGSPEIVDMLIQFGADRTLKNADGKTAYQLCYDADTAKLLMPRGKGSSLRTCLAGSLFLF